MLESASPPRSRPRVLHARRHKRNRRIRLKGKPLPSLREVAARVAAPVKKNARPLASLALLALAVAVPVAAGFILTHAKHFAVTQIAFSNTNRVEPDSLERRVQNALGTNIFRVEITQLEQQLLREPWVRSVQIHRELPATLRVDVVEREAAAAVALDAIYLVDATGAPFKRATADEAANLPIPIITGLSRERFARERLRSLQLIRDAMLVHAAWTQPTQPTPTKKRPELGEVHVDRLTGVTLYTLDGQGIRLGIPDEKLPARLARVEAVLESLKARGEVAKMIYADNRSRPDRISVRLKGAAASNSPSSEKES